jgi:hypothetical protein
MKCKIRPQPILNICILILKMVPASSSDMSVPTYRTVWYHKPDHNLNDRCYKMVALLYSTTNLYSSIKTIFPWFTSVTMPKQCEDSCWNADGRWPQTVMHPDSTYYFSELIYSYVSCGYLLQEISSQHELPSWLCYRNLLCFSTEGWLSLSLSLFTAFQFLVE